VSFRVSLCLRRADGGHVVQLDEREAGQEQFYPGGESFCPLPFILPVFPHTDCLARRPSSSGRTCTRLALPRAGSRLQAAKEKKR
jgi:hypothetical protein